MGGLGENGPSSVTQLALTRRRMLSALRCAHLPPRRCGRSPTSKSSSSGTSPAKGSLASQSAMMPTISLTMYDQIQTFPR